MTHDATGPEPPVSDDQTTTIGQLEDRSNRNSWRIMYVFITIVVLLFLVLGVAAFLGQNNS
jgi:hypothetical protein